MQELDFAIEMNHEGVVLIWTQHVIQEAVASRALLVNDAALAFAGVHQQAESQRKIGFPGEIADGLRPAVFFQGEIILAEIGHDLAVFVAHGGQDSDHVDFDGDLGLRRLLGLLRRLGLLLRLLPAG